MPDIISKYIECYCLKKVGDEVKFLLLKRCDTDKFLPGEWQIITGRIEKDEKAYISAARETIEETGIGIKRFFVGPTVTTFYSYIKDTINIIPLFIAEMNDENVKISSEHSDFKWLSAEECRNYLYWDNQKESMAVINDYLTDPKKFNTLVEIKL